jgi:hypothetical protein
LISFSSVARYRKQPGKTPVEIARETVEEAVSETRHTAALFTNIAVEGVVTLTKPIRNVLFPQQQPLAS